MFFTMFGYWVQGGGGLSPKGLVPPPPPANSRVSAQQSPGWGGGETVAKLNGGGRERVSQVLDLHFEIYNVGPKSAFFCPKPP